VTEAGGQSATGASLLARRDPGQRGSGLRGHSVSRNVTRGIRLVDVVLDVDIDLQAGAELVQPAQLRGRKLIPPRWPSLGRVRAYFFLEDGLVRLMIFPVLIGLGLSLSPTSIVSPAALTGIDGTSPDDAGRGGIQ